MKKYSMILCAVALVAMLTTSCKKEKENASFQAQFPAFTEENDGEKLYLDYTDGYSYWNNDDRLMIYNVSVSNPASSVCKEFVNSVEGERLGRFTPASGGGVGDIMDAYYAFYPYSVVDGLKDFEGVSKNDNRETFNFSDTQTYTLTSAGNATLDPNSMYFVGKLTEGDCFSFYHVGGILRLYLTGTKIVEKIVVEDPTYNLTGRVSLKLHEVDAEKLQTLLDLYLAAGGNPWENPAYLNQWATLSDLGYMSEPTGRVITLDCSADGGVQLSMSSEKQFFIGVRPGAFKNGLKITVNFTDGTFKEIEDYLGIDKTIKPGKVRGIHNTVN